MFVHVVARKSSLSTLANKAAAVAAVSVVMEGESLEKSEIVEKCLNIAFCS